MKRLPSFARLFLALGLAGFQVHGAALLDVGESTGVKGAAVEVDVTLAGDVAVAALQFDLLFDNNQLEAGVPSLGGQQLGHEIDSEIVAPGRLRVAVYSGSNAALLNGSIATIPFQVGNQVQPGELPLMLPANQVVLSRVNGQSVTGTSLNDGVVTVDPGLGLVQIGGRVRYFGGGRETLSGVTLRIVSTSIEETVSDDQGRFRFDVPAETGFVLDARVVDPVSAVAGLDLRDLFDARKHLTLVELLESPLGVMAADVNTDQAVDELDIGQIRDLLLGKRTEFEGAAGGVPSIFRFVSSDLRFVDQQDPWPSLGASGENAMRRVSSVSFNRLNEDFTGLKLGDVNGDWSAGGEIQPRPGSEGGQLIVSSGFAEFGGLLELPLRSDNLTDLVGLQLDLSWDAGVLEFVGLVAGGLSDISTDVHAHVSAPGRLRVVWDDPTALGVGSPGSSILGSLAFRAVAAVGASTRLSVDDAVVLSRFGFEEVVTVDSLVTTIDPNLATTVFSSGSGVLVDYEVGDHFRVWSLVTQDGPYVLETSPAVTPPSWEEVDRQDSRGGIVSLSDVGNTMGFQQYFRIVPIGLTGE